MLSIIARGSDLENNAYVVPQLIDGKEKRVSFERPDGNMGHARNVSIVRPGFINEFAMEYSAFEFTRDCNVSCPHCYVTAKKINGHEPTYISLDFVIDLAREMKDSPLGRKRIICITGGEPTLDIDKLGVRYGVLNELIKHKQIDIATNLLAIPCNEDAIGDFFSKFGDAVIQASYSPYLEKQYELIAQRMGEEAFQKFEGKLPENAKPEQTLLEKIRQFDDYAHKHGKNFRIRVNGVNREEMDACMEKVKSYIGHKGREEDEFIYAARVVKVGNGKKLGKAAEASEAVRQCSHQEEIYMCSNGDLYPTVNHIDNIRNRIGTLVRIK